MYPNILNLEKVSQEQYAYTSLHEKVPADSSNEYSFNDAGLADIVVTLDSVTTGLSHDIQLIIQLSIDKTCLKLDSSLKTLNQLFKM